MKVVYANFGQRNEYVSDSRSNEHYLKIPVYRPEWFSSLIFTIA